MKFTALIAILCIIFYQDVSGFIYDTLNHGGPGGPGGPGGFQPFHHCQPINMFCHLTCANGYEQDGAGCDVCHCKGTDPHLLSVDGTHHHIQNPCIPSQQSCPLNCETYVKGGTGCEFCMCATSHSTTPSVTTNTRKPVSSTTKSAPPTTVQPSDKTTQDPMDCQLTIQVCNQRCNGEYLIDHKDCTFCVCKSDLGQ